MILVTSKLIHKNFVAVALWPFVLVKDKSMMENPVLINHEAIHLKQQRELWVLPFYLLYVLEWLAKACVLKNFHRAYRAISFEQEAYQQEQNLNYLKSRPPYGFRKFIFHWNP